MEQKKRIDCDNINVILNEYITKKTNYMEFGYMPILTCVIEDLAFAFGEIFTGHTLPNFNTCFNIHRFAFISVDNSKSTLELVTNYNYFHESSLWEHAMSKWMSAFAQKYGLNSNFEYLFFFNFYGDATLYLNLNEHQLTVLQKFFVVEHDATRMTHRWSYEIVAENNFLEHMWKLLDQPPINDAGKVLACYALKSIDAIEHNRSCSFSMLPLRLDLMRGFLEKNEFFKPTTRISFEYILNAPIEDVALYTCWIDFVLFAFQLYCVVFDIQIRVFSVAHREDNRVLINFYFENEHESEEYSDLLQNLAANSFGVRLVPGSIYNDELVEVVSGMIKLDSDFNFAESLPSEKISYYALFDFGKRSILRNHSYACDEPSKGIQSFQCFIWFRSLFLDKFKESGNLSENHKLWFNPGEL